MLSSCREPSDRVRRPVSGPAKDRTGRKHGAGVPKSHLRSRRGAMDRGAVEQNAPAVHDYDPVHVSLVPGIEQSTRPSPPAARDRPLNRLHATGRPRLRVAPEMHDPGPVETTGHGSARDDGARSCPTLDSSKKPASRTSSRQGEHPKVTRRRRAAARPGPPAARCRGAALIAVGLSRGM